MKHQVVQPKDRPLPSLFSWSWLGTFRGDCLPYINPVTSPAFSLSKTNWEYMCVEKRKRVHEWNERLRQACTTDCMPAPHLENVPSNSSHVLFSKQCNIVPLWAVIALNTNSMKTLDKTSSLIFFVMHNSFFNNGHVHSPDMLHVVTWL